MGPLGPQRPIRGAQEASGDIFWPPGPLFGPRALRRGRRRPILTGYGAIPSGVGARGLGIGTWAGNWNLDGELDFDGELDLDGELDVDGELDLDVELG